MKKWIILILAMVTLTTACGRSETAAVPDIDLEEFYEMLAKEYQWSDTYMVDIEEEMLDSYYPGLKDIPEEQLVAKMPMMSSVVTELVFMECDTEEDASNAVGILQDRIDVQANGGAWYPESMEAWSHGIVIQQGTYVAMIASAEHQDEITEAFNQKFQ